MRKHVRPAHPLATIPDPARKRDLPSGGLVVDWSVHWARLAQRGDVVVTDVEPAADADPAGPSPAAEPPAEAGHDGADTAEPDTHRPDA